MAMTGVRNFFMDTVSAVTATKPAGIPLGTVRWEGGDMFQFVYNTDSSPIYPGYGASIGTGTSGYSVVLSSVSRTGAYLGLVCKQTLSAACYGWLLRNGVGTFIADVDSANTSYAKLFVGTNGTFQFGSFTSAGSAADPNTYQQVGYMIQTSCASGASGVGRFNF